MKGESKSDDVQRQRQRQRPAGRGERTSEVTNLAPNMALGGRVPGADDGALQRPGSILDHERTAARQT